VITGCSFPILRRKSLTCQRRLPDDRGRSNPEGPDLSPLPAWVRWGRGLRRFLRKDSLAFFFSPGPEEEGDPGKGVDFSDLAGKELEVGGGEAIGMVREEMDDGGGDLNLGGIENAYGPCLEAGGRGMFDHGKDRPV